MSRSSFISYDPTVYLMTNSKSPKTANLLILILLANLTPRIHPSSSAVLLELLNCVLVAIGYYFPVIKTNTATAPATFMFTAASKYNFQN